MKNTALSRREVLDILHLHRFCATNMMYVGGIGIKLLTNSAYRKYIARSEDYDLAASDIPQDLQTSRVNMIDEIEIRRIGLTTYPANIISPFFVHVCNLDHRRVHLFKEEIGPIPLEESDFEKAEKICGVPAAPPNLLIATHINPYAINCKRLRRVALMCASVEVELDAVEQKMRESCEVVERKGASLTRYRNEFHRWSRRILHECRKWERRGIDTEALEEIALLMLRV